MNKMILINTSESNMAKNEGITKLIKDLQYVYITFYNRNTLPFEMNLVFHLSFLPRQYSKARAQYLQ